MTYSGSHTGASRMQGFSMVGLLTTLGIVGILLSMTVPSYTGPLRESRRTDAHTVLLEMMVHQQRFMTVNGTFTSNLGQLGYTVEAGNVVSENGYYGITAEVCDEELALADCVRLRATGRLGQTSDGYMTLDSTGSRLPADKW